MSTCCCVHATVSLLQQCVQELTLFLYCFYLQHSLTHISSWWQNQTAMKIINGIIWPTVLAIISCDFAAQHKNQQIRLSASLRMPRSRERQSRLLSLNKSFIPLSCRDWSQWSGKVFLTVRIKVCARLKVCNWLARHVWNSQMSMKFKEAAKVGWESVHRGFSDWNAPHTQSRSINSFSWNFYMRGFALNTR